MRYWIFLFLFSTCYGVEQGFIEAPQRIEFFTVKPEGTGPFPVMFLLHGYQSPENNIGGKQLVDFHYLDYFVNQGIAVVSISTPGYGHSEGKRDFAGPDSQKAVAAVIDHFAKLSWIDSKRMGIYGICKGSSLASMVHVYYPDLSIQILEAGWYDFTTRLAMLPDYLNGIKENLLRETDGSEEALKDRSAVCHTANIHCKTLILAGEFDDRRTLPSSRALHEQLLSEGKESRLKIFPNELARLSLDKWDAIIPFIRENFFDQYGIGIKITLLTPAIQVTKIHPGSPAEQSHLKVGDVILSISPNNDSEEINTLRMPIPKFISLVLGKKGTPVRLHVLHFDQTAEDIVIERG